ncbi:MAG: ribbon-helix-helix domain-containing protein [Alphaproteobacteria bacterium]|nr:ribbon-helix-helix domain-containing protein [Alphaproteobacteria bacterium]
MRKKSVLIAGRHATSICLEDEFFEALQLIAAEQNLSLNQLVTNIDKERSTSNLSSAIRLYILKYYQNKSAAPK